MLQKLIVIVPVLAILWLLFFHRAIPRWTRRLGQALGGAGRAGRELVSDEEVENSPLGRYESEIGRALTAKVLSAQPLSTDVPLGERLARIGARLAATARRRDLLYRFAALEDAVPGALGLPGGTVFVTTALAARLGDDEDALAALLAHEFAHIERRDAVRAFAAQAAARRGLRLFGRAGGWFASRISSELAGALEGLLGEGYGEDVELAADRAARETMAAAGFDPQGLERLLRRLEAPPPHPAALPLAVAPYFQRHPSAARRLHALAARR